MKCNEPVPLPGRRDTNRASTYCQLESGHSGAHAITTKKIIQCAAEKDGKRCEQPLGHFGSHSVGGVVKVSWE